MRAILIRLMILWATAIVPQCTVTLPPDTSSLDQPKPPAVGGQSEPEGPIGKRP